MTEPVVAARAPAKVTLEAGKDYWWCACGMSKNQPFCDGTPQGRRPHADEVRARKGRRLLALRLQALQQEAAVRRHAQDPGMIGKQFLRPGAGGAGAGARRLRWRCRPSPTPSYCPPPLTVADAQRLTHFKDGPGRDPRDIAYEAALVNAGTSCSLGRGQMDVTLVMRIAVNAGPSVERRHDQRAVLRARARRQRQPSCRARSSPPTSGCRRQPARRSRRRSWRSGCPSARSATSRATASPSA